MKAEIKFSSNKYTHYTPYIASNTFLPSLTFASFLFLQSREKLSLLVLFINFVCGYCWCCGKKKWLQWKKRKTAVVAAAVAVAAVVT